jgi:PAS domain S-box-containing protein
MTPGATRTDDIRSDIEERFGFFPPFFAPALDSPAVLENLWQQTLRSYLGNTLPPVLLERLFAVLSRYCDVPYCLVCHSCALRPMGMDAASILNLLDGPHGLPGADEAAAELDAADQNMTAWADPGPVADAALRAAVSLFLRDNDRPRLAPALRRVVPSSDMDQLVMFLGYVATCLEWSEAHPELAVEADLRAVTNLEPLLAEEPELADFFTDYTRRRSAVRSSGEVALTSMVEDADRRFFLTFENAPLGMALTELDGQFIRVNRALCQVLGYDEATLTQMTCYDITAPENANTYRENVNRLVAAELPRFQMDKRYRRADGVHLWVRQSVALLRARDGTPLYLISHTEDITALRQHSDQLAATMTELQRSNRDLTQFGAVVAHDLKGPLAAIVGSAGLLDGDLPADIPAEDRQLVQRIAASGSRMGELIDDLLSYAQVGTQRLDVRWTNVDTLLAELMDDLRTQLDLVGAETRVASLGGVWAHPTHLRQVFANLITNAVKYTAPGIRPAIEITAIEYDDDVIYTVADNGIGVPADAAGSIFTMFHREHADTAEGTGVGLAICQRIIERHGGSIWVDTRPEGGSKFCIRLPRNPSWQPPISADPVPQTHQATATGP